MKSNLKLILSSIILIIVNSAFAQSKYFHIKNITNGNELSFLVLSNKKDSLAAEKINQMLQLSELELLNGYQKKNIFEKIGVKFDGETLSNGKVNISYSIISNNFKFISIKFDETFCDMTCHYWVRYYNFNSANGYLMQLKDFFTEKGFAAFKKKILKKRTEKFNKELLKENTQKEHFSYVLACIKDNDLHDFFIKNNSIIIDGENCLNKNQKSALDMTVKYALWEFQPYLNDCGKAFFGLSSDSTGNFYSNQLPQLFERTIGNSEILFVIDTVKNTAKGIYAYLKYGKGINFDGKLNGKNLVLTEYSDKNGYINAQFYENEIA